MEETEREHRLRVALEAFILAKGSGIPIMLNAADKSARVLLKELFPGYPVED